MIGSMALNKVCRRNFVCHSVISRPYYITQLRSTINRPARKHIHSIIFFFKFSFELVLHIKFGIQDFQQLVLSKITTCTHTLISPKFCKLHVVSMPITRYNYISNQALSYNLLSIQITITVCLSQKTCILVM
jgi:hypothetical protein